MSQTATSETLGFQAEVKQLLHLMIHSLYSNKEIFLRELVSNASDACDKLRFEAIDNPALLEGDGELAITVGYDKEARTITISDNGIGLSREEAVANLGTIARSGTREFFSQLTGDKQKDAQLIGQFGVGFYSSFIVADKVTVVSRRAGATDAIRWESDGQGEFTIAAADKATRGTDVTLHLRADEDELLNGWKLREILRRYSDHISLPIRMAKEEWDAEKGEQVKQDELETVNQANALWARNKADVTEEQYREFYKTVSHDYDDPLAWTHNRVEGRSEYTQLLYVPKHAPMDLWDRDDRRGVKLYVKRVFIMDDADQLLPSYLRFVRGVVAHLTRTHEATQPRPWKMSDAPSDFVDTMLKAIVGIEIEVTRLEGKLKLSQNKEVRDIRGAGTALAEQGSTMLGEAMLARADAKERGETQ